jgi:hypothetical protein
VRACMCGSVCTVRARACVSTCVDACMCVCVHVSQCVHARA